MAGVTGKSSPITATANFGAPASVTATGVIVRRAVVAAPAASVLPGAVAMPGAIAVPAWRPAPSSAATGAVAVTTPVPGSLPAIGAIGPVASASGSPVTTVSMGAGPGNVTPSYTQRTASDRAMPPAVTYPVPATDAVVVQALPVQPPLFTNQRWAAQDSNQ